MDTLVQLLKNTDLFADLPEEIILQEILPHRQIQEYHKGQFLIAHQERVNRFAVIVSGKIHIMHLFPEGNYSLMSVMSVGEILGADLICTRTQIAPYHAMAATSARVLYFPVELLTKPGMIQEPYRLLVMDHLLTLISNENMKKEYRLAILSQRGLRERILTYLSMQSSRLRKSTFAISFSREELAAFLCVNRSALSHELSVMQQEGLISFRKNIFTIHKRSNLV